MTRARESEINLRRSASYLTTKTSSQLKENLLPTPATSSRVAKLATITTTRALWAHLDNRWAASAQAAWAPLLLLVEVLPRRASAVKKYLRWATVTPTSSVLLAPPTTLGRRAAPQPPLPPLR